MPRYFQVVRILPCTVLFTLPPTFKSALEVSVHMVHNVPKSGEVVLLPYVFIKLHTSAFRKFDGVTFHVCV
jgi:hypothetical protein